MAEASVFIHAISPGIMETDEAKETEGGNVVPLHVSSRTYDFDLMAATLLMNVGLGLKASDAETGSSTSKVTVWQDGEPVEIKIRKSDFGVALKDGEYECHIQLSNLRVIARDMISKLDVGPTIPVL